MADFDPDAYLAKPFDPDAYLAKGAEAAPAKPPEMFLSLPDASGRMHAEPSTNYNLSDPQIGIIQRAREGASAPMQNLGISEEHRRQYPMLDFLQPAARTLDVALKTPASIFGGAAGAAAGVAEKVFGRSWANRAQRDFGELPAAIAPEVPVAAPEVAAMRRAGRPPGAPPVREAPAPLEPPPLPPEVSAIPRQVTRDGPNVGLLQTEVPHALPAAQSRALSAAGNGGPLQGLHQETIDFLRQKMAAEGFTQHTIDQRLGEMSAHQFFGEIGPSLELDMSGIAAHPGPGRVEIMGSTRQRGIEGPERAGHSLNRAFGEQENIPQFKRLLEIERQQATTPLYQRFRETEITPTPQIEALLPRLEAAGVLQGANRALRIEGQPTTRGFNIPGEPPTVQRVPTAGAFQLVLEDISGRIGKALKDSDRGEVRRLTDLRNDVITALDTHPNVGDTWRQARAAHAGPAAIQDAVELGRTVLSDRVTADELPFLTAHYNDAQMRALRIGIHDTLRQKLGKRDTLTADLHNTVLSPNNVQKLRWAIGDEAAERLVAEFEHERYMHTAPTRIHGGSPTAQRTAAIKSWDAPEEAPGITLGDVAGAIKKPGKTAAAAAVGAAEKFGVSQRRAAAVAKWERIREEAARIMTLQGPERDAVARYLVGENPVPPVPPPYRRGGKVPYVGPDGVRERVKKLRAGGRVRGYDDGGEVAYDPLSGARIGGDLERTEPEAYPNRLTRATIQSIGGMPVSMATLPKRAIESAANYAETGHYSDPGPVLEAAMLPMGTGAMAGVRAAPGEAVLGSGPVRRYNPPHEPAAPPAAAPAEAVPAGAMGPGGGGSAGARGLPEAQATAARWAGERQALEGIPGPLKIGEDYFVPGPIGKIHDVAEEYMRAVHPDRPYTPPTKYHPLDPEHSKAIAQAYEEMKHTPNDPATKASYDALIDETAKQYEAIKKTGLKIEPIPAGAPDPYAANPRMAAIDVAENNHLWFFPTEGGFGTVNKITDNPMLRKTGEKIGDHELLANDMFRIVHDYFGHLKEGHGFRAAGEDNAWRTHSAMYSDIARPAMTTETRGQNSWVNYGPHGEKNRTASAADTVYADQKVGLMPEWVMRDRGSPTPMMFYHGTPHSFNRFDISKIGQGEGNAAYGHGLYFAGHEPVSEWYRHQLATRQDPLLKKYGIQEVGHVIGAHLADAKGNPLELAQEYAKLRDHLIKHGPDDKASANMINEYDRRIRYLNDPARSTGHVYQVQAKVDPEHLLDFDKTFQEQSSHVQERTDPFLRESVRNQIEAIKKAGERRMFQNKPVLAAMEGRLLSLEQTGHSAFPGTEIYNRVGLPAKDRNEAAVKASNWLLQHGIPGHRYLDAGSRGRDAAGRPTHNYVMYGDEPLQIYRRYRDGGIVDATLRAHEARRYDNGGSVFDFSGVSEALPEASIKAGQEPPDLLLRAGKSMLDLPRRAITGSAQDVQHLGEPGYERQAVGPAAETALSIAGARLPWAKEGTVGVFGGRLAETADKVKLRRAEEMHAAGAPREDIFRETGWFQGPDKQWRFEIPDEAARFKPGVSLDAEGTYTMRGAFEHPALYEAYPDIGKRPFEVRELPDATSSYYPREDKIVRGLAASATPAREVQLHELQHMIQKREGFARGANLKMPEVGQAAVQDFRAAKQAAQSDLDQLWNSRQAWLDNYAATNKLDLTVGADYQRANKAYATTFPELEAARTKAYETISNPYMPSEYRHNAYERYAGETEARNVQKRSHYGPAERRDIAPWETEDIPADRQIVDYRSVPAEHRPIPKPRTYYEGEPITNAGVDAPPRPRIQTVADPYRMMFPGIYRNPRIIAEEAAARVGPEDPAMKQLFGVTRGDLYEMGKGRVGNEAPRLSLADRPRGSLAAQNIQTPQNTQRLIDVMAEAGKHEGLRHADAWYVMDPMYHRMKEMFGPEAAQRYRHLNTTTGMASPGSEVLTEIQRGTGAHWLQEAGRFNDFKKYIGLDNATRHAARMPQDIQYIQGHPYHRTSQVEPMEKYFASGSIQSDAPKVPLYVHASGVPETGFQTTGPVGDAHFSRATGLSDTRKGPTDVGSSFSRSEYQTLQPWWQHDVAAPLGLEAVPAQARTWTVFGPQTGVESELGAPKLELFSKQIMKAAKRLGVSPEKARDMILSGKAGAGKRGGAVGPNFTRGGLVGATLRAHAARCS